MPSHRRTSIALSGALLLSLGVASLGVPIPARAAELDIVETGSTLMLPLLQNWTQAYKKVAPNVTIATAGTNSGAGIDASISGTAQIGASDAYMSDVQLQQHPGILNIPLAISAQLVLVNLPEVTAPLKLSGPVLAGIYSGTIRDWSDAKIAGLNPGVTLPHQAIIPIRRSDAAGDTFLFTPVPDLLDAGVGGRARLRHQRHVAAGARREDGGRQ